MPLIYMGDELGLRNDPRWADDPAHAGDNRWMHRPPMDWAAAERRHDPSTVEGRLWARPAAARRAPAAARAPSTPRAAASRCGPATTTSSALLREHAGERLLLLANFTALEQTVHAGVAPTRLALGPYEFRWIA